MQPDELSTSLDDLQELRLSTGSEHDVALDWIKARTRDRQREAERERLTAGAAGTDELARAAYDLARGEEPGDDEPRRHQLQDGQEVTLHLGEEESHLRINGEETTASIALPDGLVDELRRRGLRPEDVVVQVSKLPTGPEVGGRPKLLFTASGWRPTVKRVAAALRLPRARSSCGRPRRPRHRRARAHAPPGSSDGEGEPEPAGRHVARHSQGALA